MKTIMTWLLLHAAAFVYAQATLTPNQNLGLKTVTIEVPAKFSGLFAAGRQLSVPPGYKVRVFYIGGLTKPRFMGFSPNGVLHVSDMRTGGSGRVYAFPDADGNGEADTAIVVAQGFTNNHDMRFYNGDLYVTESTKVWKCTDANMDGLYENKTTFISNIGGGATTGHTTRTIVFDSLNQKLYLSIGSLCNVCRESNRAIVEQYNIDGTGQRTYATGVRNAVGMSLHPVTNRLWANNNGSDNQGNETPPEWVDLLRDGGFYGYPFAHSERSWFDFDLAADYAALKPITAVDTQLVNSMVKPAALIRAHSAPMALQFLNSSFPANLNKGFLVALRGSWNTTSPKDFRGYKVVYAHLSSNTDTTVDYVSDFCAGFLTDSINRVYWGRPVGLAADNKGNIYISSDEGSKVILQMYPDFGVGMQEPVAPLLQQLAAYPNPFAQTLGVSFYLQAQTAVQISLYNITGSLVYESNSNSMEPGNHKLNLPVESLTEGIYLLRVKAGEAELTQRVQCVK